MLDIGAGQIRVNWYVVNMNGNSMFHNNP